jgi:ATP-dependent exoDNAse (exonuclease V) alpha subunit
MAQAAYTGWKTDMLAGKTTLMAAADGADVTALSAQARADRVAAGQVEPDGIRLRDGTLARAGDWIVTRHNQRRLSLFAGRDFVKNGDAWHVEHRRPDGSLTVRGMGHGGRVTLPAAYVRDHVQLLYATTAHRAQGSTVDTAHPLITAGMSREALYVLATRAHDRSQGGPSRGISPQVPAGLRPVPPQPGRPVSPSLLPYLTLSMLRRLLQAQLTATLADF